ncbi:MAG: hypothetical protein EAS51_09740 [Microbacteriaceae bacterium]|nr:MAG: hypothetical protein EAS51_09740 [Microbacteriaceae bacterium]
MTDSITPQEATRMRIRSLALLPAPIIALAAMLAFASPALLWPILIGAAGWLVALVLRQPVALISGRNLSQEKAARVVGWFSGPAEELVRLAMVLLLIRTAQEAAWAGWGWATVEVLIIAVNVFAIAGILTKDDPKSREARELLAAQGMLKDHHPAWGFLERISATALHTGFTLLLFAQPWLVLVTLPLHSVTNMLAARFGKTHVALTELALLAVGAGVLTWGILALA